MLIKLNLVNWNIAPSVLSYVSSKIILLIITVVAVKCTVRTKYHFVSSHVLIICFCRSNICGPAKIVTASKELRTGTERPSPNRPVLRRSPGTL